MAELDPLGLAAWALCGHETPAGCNASDDASDGSPSVPAGGPAASGTDAFWKLVIRNALFDRTEEHVKAFTEPQHVACKGDLVKSML